MYHEVEWMVTIGYYWPWCGMTLMLYTIWLVITVVWSGANGYNIHTCHYIVCELNASFFICRPYFRMKWSKPNPLFKFASYYSWKRIAWLWLFTVIPLCLRWIQYFLTERGGSVVMHEIRIREVPVSNPGADQPDWGFFRGFPQSSRQMLCWIFITTIHLTIIHKIHVS